MGLKDGEGDERQHDADARHVPFRGRGGGEINYVSQGLRDPY